jgi:tetratricopeptide (TPR) repeat protein
VWWDHALENHGDYEIEIRNKLNEARVVVVIWTREAGESDWVKAEAGRASRTGRLVNVRSSGLSWDDVPLPFDQYHFRDLDDIDGILRLIASVWAGNPPPTVVPLHEIYFRHHGERLIDPKQSRLGRDLREISPVELLHARSAVVHYADVTSMKAGLLAWCRDGTRPTAGRLAHGPGGLGKTRLLIEVAAELRKSGWMAGFLDPPYTDNVAAERWQALDQLIAHGDDDGLLMVMDYAEARQKELRELAERLVRRPEGDTRPVRLVLLARTAGEWWTMLHDKTAEIQRLFRRDTHGPGVIELPAIATPEQRRALFFASAEAMAPTLAGQGYDIPIGEPSPVRLVRIEHEAGHARPLAVQMEALLWLTSASPDAGPVGVDKLLTGVLGLERNHWGKVLRDDRNRVSYLDDLDDGRERDILRGVAQVTIVQGTGSKTSSERLLMADRYYGDQRKTRVAVAPVLRDLLRLCGKPDDAGVRQLEPDLIGEHLVAMTADPELIDGCLAWIGEEPPETREKRRRDLITALQRATHPDHGEVAANASAMLDHLVSTRARDLAAGMVAVMTDTPGALLDQVERHLNAFDEETLETVNDALPQQSLSLMEFSVRIAARLADCARKTSAAGGTAPDVSPGMHEASLGHLADTLNLLGARLSLLGRIEEALPVSQEAVAIDRRLADIQPAAFLPDLAKSLNNMCWYLSNLDRREEALVASNEAVSIYRRLADTHPDAFLSDLARSLNNLGNDLSNLRRHVEALAASREAIFIYRRLADTAPDAFLPDLAMSLNNVSGNLSDLGHREEALTASQEALSVYRRLADTQPDAFLPDLAMSLENLSIHLSDLDRHEEALKAGQEAIVIRRRLADIRPDTFLPDLARSLRVQGRALTQAGRHPDAAQALGDGLAIIVPFIERLQTFDGLATGFRRDYIAACRKAGTKPDEALLKRVARELDGNRLLIERTTNSPVLRLILRGVLSILRIFRAFNRGRGDSS